MGRLISVIYDFTTQTGPGQFVGTPRTQAAPTPYTVRGNQVVFPVGIQGRLRRLVASPLLTAAELAGAAADVVKYRDAQAKASFRVDAGADVAAGPFSGIRAIDPSTFGGGVAGADVGGRGRGVILGLVVVDLGTGIGCVLDFQGQTATVSVAYAVEVEIEMAPWSSCVEVLGGS